MPPRASSPSHFNRSIALEPPPAWLEAVLGAPVRRAALTWHGRSVLVHSATEKATHVLQLGSPDAYGNIAFRLESDGQGGTRRTAVRPTELNPETEHDIKAFLARVSWIRSGRPSAGGAHPASDRERALLAAMQLTERFARAESPQDLTLPRYEGLSDPVLYAAETMLAIACGRWDDLMSDTERAGEPAWVRTVRVGLRGSIAELRASGEAPPPMHGGFCTIAGATFALTKQHDAALRAYRGAFESVVGPERADLALEVARLTRAVGRADEAKGWARRAILIRPKDDSLLRRATFELRACGALDDAFVALRERCRREPFERDLSLDLAALLTWSARSQEALSLVERALELEEDTTALRLRGAIHALEGEWDEAERSLTRARALSPKDPETLAWLAELNLRRGDRDAADELLEASRTTTQGPLHEVLRAAIEPRLLSHNEAALRRLLELLDEPYEPWKRQGEERVRAGLNVLKRFGGNRGTPTTYVTPRTDDSELGARVLEVPRHDPALTARAESAALLRRLGELSAEEIRARFDELAAQHPASAHPLCYRGELELWMGRYEDAIAAFRRAHERHTARWAFVGRAAARIMLGEYEEADKLFRTCARVFPPVVGATTHVYAGEALRRRGALAEAVDELTIAVETKAGRVGAWLNLALAHHALGDEASVIPIRDALDEKVPGLFWDATRAAGLTPSTRVELEHLPVVYEAALTMMRGNRSSHLITYFDSDGVMRIARDARTWRTTVRKHLSFVSRALESAIASGCAR